MRSAFGNWLIDRRIPRIALIAALLPLFGVVSAAIVVCVAIVKGWREALFDTLIAVGILSALTLLSGGGLAQILFSSLSTWGLALLLGGLTGLYGSLTLAIQAVVIVSCLAVLGFVLVVPDTVVFWQDILQMITGQLQEMGVELGDPEAIYELAPVMSGLMAAGTIVSSIIALLIGCWWAGEVRGKSLRELFIELRLGYVIGAIAALAGVGALLGFQPLAANLLLVAGVGFLFQGLAVVHWHVARRELGWYILIPVYLPFLLGASFFVTALMIYSAIGFFDNWYGLRRIKTS